METPLDVLSRAASLVHADDEKREAALRGDPRMQSMTLSSAVSSHRTGPPPISPSKRKHSGDQGDDDIDCDNEHLVKMSRLFAAQLGKPANGDCYRKDPRERSRSPIERAVAPSIGLHGNHPYAHMPSLAMDQPLALTKNNMDAARTMAPISPVVSSVARQQNRPSVITCAPANKRNCNLSHCPVSHNGCSSSLPPNYRRTPNTPTNTACDPVIEEHFRRSLGKNYKEPEPLANSVSITGSVDDHFAKALGETWLQIKAKGSSTSSPDSSPSNHMVNHNHSPSLVS
ncbi:LOW QUALITY PROTEIN: transcription cofactor vestigial-like protein 4b [Osmerus mordax]|uniref:LOW QUALITY PROTEIN: transcription cofactor vestigial-like protein 4b n=1 Tax=Osmerus mordax TaxID=8014 RepID=UPI0035105E4F